MTDEITWSNQNDYANEQGCKVEGYDERNVNLYRNNTHIISLWVKCY